MRCEPIPTRTRSQALIRLSPVALECLHHPLCTLHLHAQTVSAAVFPPLPSNAKLFRGMPRKWGRAGHGYGWAPTTRPGWTGGPAPASRPSQMHASCRKSRFRSAERTASIDGQPSNTTRSQFNASLSAHDLISAEHDSWSSARTAWIEVALILPQVSQKLPTPDRLSISPQVQNGRLGSTGDTVSISATHDFWGPRRTAVIDRQRSASRPSEGQESQSRPPDGSHASLGKSFFSSPSVSLSWLSPSQLQPIQSRVSFGGRKIPFRSWKARLPRPLVFPTLVWILRGSTATQTPQPDRRPAALRPESSSSPPPLASPLMGDMTTICSGWCQLPPLLQLCLVSFFDCLCLSWFEIKNTGFSFVAFLLHELVVLFDSKIWYPLSFLWSAVWFQDLRPLELSLSVGFCCVTATWQWNIALM